MLVESVYAQVNTTIDSTFGPDITNLSQLFAFALNLVLAVGFALVLIMLALGFVQYIMSQGDKTGVEKAQKWVTYSVVGGLGLFLVFVLRNVLAQVAGIEEDVSQEFGTGVSL